MGRDMESIVASREQELRTRVDEQQHELESLREQKRDKDAAINFLKTKITSLQNKAGSHSANRTGGEQQEPMRTATVEDELKFILTEKERQIEELELQVLAMHQELELQIAALKEEMKQRELVHIEEMKAVREQSAIGGTNREEADELRQRLQFRDEQVHTLGQAYENLQHQCQLQARSGEEELQRKEEHNQRLAVQLKRAAAEIEELQRQLRLRENEVAQLADSLQACREKEWQQKYVLDDVVLPDPCLRSNVRNGSSPPSARPLGWEFRHPSHPTKTSPIELTDGAKHGGSCSSRGSPRAPPTPHSPIESTGAPKTKGAVPVESIMLEEVQWAEKVPPTATSPELSSRGNAHLGLQEREEGVLQLQEEIRKEIAKHRNSFAQQSSAESPHGSRCPWPVAPGNGTSRGDRESPQKNGNAQELSPSTPEVHVPSTSGSNVGPTSPLELVATTETHAVPQPIRRSEVVPIFTPITNAVPTLGRRPEASSCSVPSSPPALPLSVSARSHPGRAATTSRVERQTKPSNRTGGALVSVNIFEDEDSSQKRSRQQAATHQRVAKQIEQRRRQIREKARPEDVCRTRAHETGTSPARNGSPGRSTPTRSPQLGSVSGTSTPTQVTRGLFRGPERASARAGSPEFGSSNTRPGSPDLCSGHNSAVRTGSPEVPSRAKQSFLRGPDRSSAQLGSSPEATYRAVANCMQAFLPSSPLIGGSAHVPLGGSTRLNGDTSLLKVGMAPMRRVGESTTAIGGTEEKKVEPSHGDLHQKFASLRDEMKRQRSPAASVIGLGDRGGSMTTSAVLSDILQQRPSMSRLQMSLRKVPMASTSSLEALSASLQAGQ